MKIAKMSIGQAVDKIPGVNRKQRKTRVDQIRKALTAAKPGAILPVYTGSPASAANLALTLRKASIPILQQAVVRRHIVYVQKRLSILDLPGETTLVDEVDEMMATPLTT